MNNEYMYQNIATYKLKADTQELSEPVFIGTIEDGTKNDGNNFLDIFIKVITVIGIIVLVFVLAFVILIIYANIERKKRIERRRRQKKKRNEFYFDISEESK